MVQKLYKLGILVGRFQTVHLGHEDMVNKAIALCDKVGIFVGSSQESGTYKNPFTFETRKEMLLRVFGDKVTVCPLPDIGVGNNSKWGDYVLKNVSEQFGTLPDLLVSGKESRRVDWFDSIDGRSISELYIPKSIDISASDMREWFVNDDFLQWKAYTNPVLWDMYDQLRKTVLLSKDNPNTDSM